MCGEKLLGGNMYYSTNWLKPELLKPLAPMRILYSKQNGLSVRIRKDYAKSVFRGVFKIVNTAVLSLIFMAMMFLAPNSQLAHEQDNSLAPISYVLDPIRFDRIGEQRIETDSGYLVRYQLPSDYYKDIDFSYFQPYMGWTAVTNTNSQQWKLLHDEHSYTDENGFRRFITEDDEFTLYGDDDYVIALGNYYKEKGLVGQRYLVVTEGGMYTARVCDEKADEHTDEMHMFSTHGYSNQFAGLVEFVVDSGSISSDIVETGTITNGPIDIFHGDILHIYRIF
jgi:hypothetical protein